MSGHIRFTKQVARDAAATQGLVANCQLAPGDSWPISNCCDTVFRNCVFNGVYFGKLIGRPAIERCAFESCDLSSANFDGCNLSSVAFRSCDFPGNALTRFRKCKMENVVFDGSKVISEMSFQSCSVSHMTMSAKEVRRLQFRDCQMADFRAVASSFAECGFVGCKLTDMDFSGIPFCEVGFIKVEINGSFARPQTGRGFAVMSATDQERILRSAKTKLSDEDYRMLDQDLAFFSSGGYPVFCSHDSFGDLKNKSAIATVIQIAGEELSSVLRR